MLPAHDAVIQSMQMQRHDAFLHSGRVRLNIDAPRQASHLQIAFSDALTHMPALVSDHIYQQIGFIKLSLAVLSSTILILRNRHYLSSACKACKSPTHPTLRDEKQHQGQFTLFRLTLHSIKRQFLS